MTLNDFLLKFFLIVAFVIAAVFGIAYFKDKRPDTEKSTALVNSSQKQSPAEQNPNNGMAQTPVSREEMVMDVPNPGPITENATTTEIGLYLPEEYTVPHTESGQVKNIDSDNGSMTIASNNEDQRVTISAATAIFKDAGKASLSDIKESENATIIGRKKTADGEEFIADSIYVSAPLDASFPAAEPAE